MTRYVQIEAANGLIWAEVDDEVEAIPSESSDGLEMVGKRDISQSFLEAVESLKDNAQTILTKLRDELTDKPDEIEVEFGLKAAGEVGNTFFALAKASAEASYTVKLKWVREGTKEPPKPTTN